MQGSELYNRMCGLGMLSSIIKKRDALFISGKASWEKEGEAGKERGNICKQVLQPLHCIELEYICKGIDEQRLIDDRFRVWYDSQKCEEYDSLDVVDMTEFLKKLNETYAILIIDVTLINTRFLGACLAVVSAFEWEGIYCCYTEPGEYIQKKDVNERKFDLKTITLGFDEIPNLQTSWDGIDECEWIIFMGFESTRLQILQVEAEPRRKYIIPVALIPAMHAEWHNYVMEANMEFMEMADKLERMQYVSAVNPYEVFNFLERERNESNFRLKISPIGTKLTVLGSILYVIKHPDDMLLTDNPIQEEKNTLSHGRSYAYDLTYFFKSVKNERFKEDGI